MRCWQTGSGGFFGGMLGVQGKCLREITLAPVAGPATGGSGSSGGGGGGGGGRKSAVEEVVVVYADIDILQNCRVEFKDGNNLQIVLVREDSSKCTLGIS